MQVINESLDDLKKLEDAIETATKGELDYSDKLFLLASAAQSKAIAGLALAIKEGGGQDTFGLTLHAPDPATQDALLQDIMEIIYAWEATTNSHQDLERALRERLGG